jgi:hypothetical protein
MTTTAHEAVASEKRSVDHHDRPIRVFLVADVCVYRELLVDALASEDGIEVAGRTPADIAGRAIRLTEPDVVLVDTSSGSGAQRVWALAAGAPAAKIVAVGIPDDESVVLGLLGGGHRRLHHGRAAARRARRGRRGRRERRAQVLATGVGSARAARRGPEG